MKKILVILLLTITLSGQTFAENLGWKSIDYVSDQGTRFSLDINVKSYQYSLGIVYYTDVWVHVSDYMVRNAHAVVLNYRYDQLVETKSFDLHHNKEAGVFEAPVPYGLDTLTQYSGWNLKPTRQEIAIKINDDYWVKVPNTNRSNFSFNIFSLFDIEV